MKDSKSKNQQGSKAVANQVVQKKSNAKSLPSAQPVQLMSMEEEEPLQGKFKQGANVGSQKE